MANLKPFQFFGSRLSLCLIASVMPWPLMFSIAGTVNGIGLRAEPERDRERHGREHVGGVVFLVDGLVADHRPAGGLHHVDVEPVLGIEAHRVRHDDRRGAGDRDESDLELLLLRRAGTLREHFGRGLQRKNCDSAASAVEAPTDFRNARRAASLREHRPHHSGSDDNLVALLLARRSRERTELRCVLRRAACRPQGQPAPRAGDGIERIVDSAHG